MLNNDELGRLSVVLVRARDPMNIGAVARAMYDFGFRDLRWVNEFPVSLERARSAVDASSVVEAAREFTSLADAVADCTLVVGTTAVGLRRREHSIRSVAEAGPLLRAELASTAGRVALLFGSEKTGLSNEELGHCHWLLTIPMYQTEGMRHASMNLGQAAAVCLYELVRDSEANVPQRPEQPATGEDMERLTQLAIEVMEESGYAARHPANFEPTLVRRLIRQTALDRGHALAWTGILKQVLWKLREPE